MILGPGSTGMASFSAIFTKRVDQADMGKAAPIFLDVWIYFNLIPNTIFLPILVATFLFSKRVKRHPTLINVCMTWILSGVFSLLLYYAGQDRGPEPYKPLCIAQTALLYGITPMWSVAVLVLVYHMVLAVQGNPADLHAGRSRMILMLSAPYIAQCAFSIAALAFAILRPDKVNRARRFFYCSLKFNPLSNAMSIFTAIMCLCIIVLEIHLAINLYRNWRGMRRAGRSTGLDLQLIVRVLTFGIYVLYGMVVDIISMFDSHNIAPDMYAATIGAVVFLVFGTQADVFRAWCFWRPEVPPTMQPIYIPQEPNWVYHVDPASLAEKFGKVSELARPPAARIMTRAELV